ncbi:ribonuclease H-like domain-containing protein [Mycena latifolia]|nr:ribonuclease H-like domain-containing protein [Mycena latifolia]
MTQYMRSKSDDTNDYDPAADKFLPRFGRGLQDGTELLGIFHIDGNHWVAATADILAEAVGYGDPMGGGVEDSDVCAALQWFAKQHNISLDNDVEELYCTTQEDGWNCGLFAPGALAHKHLPDAYPLIGPSLVLGDLGRMEILRKIIERFHERDPSSKALSSIVALDMHEYSMIPSSERYSTSPITPPPVASLANELGRLSVSPSKRPEKRRKIHADPDEEPPMAPLFTKVAAGAARKKTVAQTVAKVKRDFKKPSAKVKKEIKMAAFKEHEHQTLLAMPSDVSDEESDPLIPGRPRSETMDQLTVEVKSMNQVRKYCCAGNGCPKTHKPRTLARVLAHAKRCIKLTSEQRQLASKSSADTSPGARAEELSKGLSAAELEPPAQQPFEFFGAAGSKQVRDRYAALLDLAIVKLFAAAGLPPRLADYPEYKEVLRLAALVGTRYVPAGRTILMDNHIMSEQERVRALQIAFLRTQTRLSVSCDGGDLRSGEGLNAQMFLTAEWIADTVTEALQPIGIERFISASSDNTGNTRGFRRIFCERSPLILNLADPDHHLNNTIKDILKLPHFKLAIKVLRGTVRHFNQSKQSKAMLKQLRINESVGRGLETIGKTRFATVTWSAISLRRNLGPVSTLCTNGQVEIKKYTSYFIKDTSKFLDFQMRLNQLISVTEGAAKAIQCLEAASCNPADVYLLWLAVTAHIRAALASSMLPEDVCNEIRGIINHRAAFYLNPKYVNSSIFKRPNAVAPFTITLPGKTPDVPIGVRNAKTFLAVAQYLFHQGGLEVEHGIDPVLITYKTKKKAFATKFQAQFTAYAQGACPFNTPLGEASPITWWRALEGSEHGGILAALALKFYSTVAHSMADERTVSVITWMNPALRNLEKVNTIFSFAQIRGWYRDVAKQKALLSGETKTRAGARPHPEVKFYNIQREIHTVDDEVEDDEDIDIDVDDAITDSDDEGMDGPGPVAKIDWLDLPREIFVSSGRLDLESGEVDLDSALLGDVLAEVPGGTPMASEGLVDEHGMDDDEDDDEDVPFKLGSWTLLSLYRGASRAYAAQDAAPGMKSLLIARHAPGTARPVGHERPPQAARLKRDYETQKKLKRFSYDLKVQAALCTPARGGAELHCSIALVEQWAQFLPGNESFPLSRRLNLDSRPGTLIIPSRFDFTPLDVATTYQITGAGPRRDLGVDLAPHHVSPRSSTLATACSALMRRDAPILLFPLLDAILRMWGSKRYYRDRYARAKDCRKPRGMDWFAQEGGGEGRGMGAGVPTKLW